MPEIPPQRPAFESDQDWSHDTQSVGAEVVGIPDLDKLNSERGLLADVRRTIRQTSARSSEAGRLFDAYLEQASHPPAAAKIPEEVLSQPGGPESEPGQTWEQAYRAELTDALRDLGTWFNNTPLDIVPVEAAELEVNRQHNEQHQLHYSKLVAGAVLRIIGATTAAEHQETDPDTGQTTAVAGYRTPIPGLTMTARATRVDGENVVKLYARFEHPATPQDHPNRPPDPQAGRTPESVGA